MWGKKVKIYYWCSKEIALKMFSYKIKKYKVQWIRADLQDIIFYLYISIYNLFCVLISLYKIYKTTKYRKKNRTLRTLLEILKMLKQFY